MGERDYAGQDNTLSEEESTMRVRKAGDGRTCPNARPPSSHSTETHLSDANESFCERERERERERECM